MITPDLDPIRFVAEHGIVLQAAKGPVPTLSHAVAGEVIRGSWWAHPRSHAIFAAFGVARCSPDILACRLLDGKVTLVHRRLWPALVRLADPVESPHIEPGRLGVIREEHTASGHHEVVESSFPAWVLPEVAAAAAALTREEAVATLGPAAAAVLRAPRASKRR